VTVLVTGGTSGIGEAVVVKLAEQGHRVVFCGRREAPGTALETKLGQLGLEVLFVPCDVSQEREVQALVCRTQDWAGALHAAVNCAGVSPRRARLTESTVEAYEEVFAINVRGTFLSVKHEMRALGQGGVIVNIASVLGIRALDLNHSLYTASKHAVIGLTKTAALEGASLGIRVNAVCPGGIDTPIHTVNSSGPQARKALTALHPLGRLGTSEEAASTVAYLLSPEAAFVTGCILSVDGGASL